MTVSTTPTPTHRRHDSSSHDRTLRTWWYDSSLEAPVEDNDIDDVVGMSTGVSNIGDKLEW